MNRRHEESAISAGISLAVALAIVLGALAWHLLRWVFA